MIHHPGFLFNWIGGGQMKQQTLLMFAVIALFVLLGPLTSTAQEAPPVSNDGLLLHVSHAADDPHRVLMPLSLAMKMSGAMPVRLFFDIEGVKVLAKDGPNLTHEGFEKGSKELIAELLKKPNVSIHICPMCMKAAGMTEADLLDGVVVANPKTFTGFTDGRIVTLDW